MPVQALILPAAVVLHQDLQAGASWSRRCSGRGQANGTMTSDAGDTHDAIPARMRLVMSAARLVPEI